MVPDWPAPTMPRNEVMTAAKNDDEMLAIMAAASATVLWALGMDAPETGGYGPVQLREDGYAIHLSGVVDKCPEGRHAELAAWIAREIVCGEPQTKIRGRWVPGATRRLRAWLDAHWSAVQAVAAGLTERRQLSHLQVDDVIWEVTRLCASDAEPHKIMPRGHVPLADTIGSD